MSVALGSFRFPSKKAAEKALQLELNRGQSLGGRVFQSSLVDAAFRNHRQFSEKTLGRLVLGYSVRPAGKWRTPCLWAELEDQDSVAFSYKECLREGDPRSDLTAALRLEIAPQICEFLRSAPRICAVTGQSIVHGEVDHESPDTFAELARRWVQSEGGLDAVPSRQVGPGERLLVDRDQAGRWQQFHKDNCRLRLLSRESHALITAGSNPSEA